MTALDKQGSFAVTFCFLYETKVGEDLYVIGSIRELGEWKNLDILPLTWTEGHVWVTKKPLIVNTQAHFTYKYILKDRESGEVVWERGCNRIADLHILGHCQPQLYHFADGLDAIEKAKV